MAGLAQRTLSGRGFLAACLLLAALSAGSASVARCAPRFRPVADDVFYMYMPIAWRDSDADPWRFGDFGGMTASLPYLKSLGVTAVWMTPVFVSPAYHGYQHGAADSLNPRFGDKAAFLSFVAAAHADSIKVFLDFVAYGISQNTPWFQDSYGNPASVFDAWLAYTNPGNTTYLGGAPYTTWDGGTVGFIHWDLRNPTVTDLVTGWAAGWLDPDHDGDPSDGVDGFRADHVSSYDPSESPWGYDIEWWVRWKAALRAVNPDVFTFAEQANWSSYGYDLFPAFDAAFTKPFEGAARFGLANADARPVASAMEATLSLTPSDHLYLTTLGDHDVARIATMVGGDEGKLRAAADVLMLQPLPPVIYFGDEIGMQGAKREDFVGDAKDIPFREPFKWNAVAGPPMSNYFAANAQAYAERVSRDHDGHSVEEQSGVPGSLLERYRALAALRHAHPGLRHGTYFGVGTPDTSVWAFIKAAPEETLLVAINLGAVDLAGRLDLASVDPASGTPVRDVETGESLAPLTIANRASYPLPLGPHAHRVVKLSAAPRDLRLDYADANLVITQDTPDIIGIDHLFELDQMFIRYDPQGLALGITGNVLDGGYALAVFLDTKDGGQNTLATRSLPEPPGGLPEMTGLKFDAGFEPDFVLFLNRFGGQLYVDWYSLATNGGGTKRYVGTVPVGATGALTGGDNPNGLVASYSPYNRAGIIYGSAAGAATATDGFRIRIPWADLGLPGAGPGLGLMAMLVIPDGYVFNQFLPGLRGFAAPLGYAPVDLDTVAGDQYVRLDQTTEVLASLVSLTTSAGAVEIVWSVAGRAHGELHAERRVAGGAWGALPAVAADARGEVRVRDEAAPRGERLGYRLLDGAQVLAETWVDVPRAPGLALLGVRAEPASGRIHVRFTSSGTAQARVEAFDVAGRRVAAEEAGRAREGEHEVVLGARGGLRPGLYFIRVREADEAIRTRTALVR